MRYPTITFVLLLVSTSSFAEPSSRDEPSEITSLRASWNKARKQATDPVDKRYLDALEAIKVRLTKAGDLNGGLAAQAEIDLVKPLGQQSSGEVASLRTKADRITVDLSGSKWTTTNWDDAIITLDESGKVLFSKGSHEKKWLVSKNGELQFTDRGSKPVSADLSARRDSFTLRMGADHECKRLKAENASPTTK
jgi:hypothetical protein